MYLKSVRIQGVGPFRDSGSVEFGSGINVIVGENGAGKTTLLAQLANLKKVGTPFRGIGAAEKPLVECSVGMRVAELRARLRERKSMQFDTPYSDPTQVAKALNRHWQPMDRVLSVSMKNTEANPQFESTDVVPWDYKKKSTRALIGLREEAAVALQASDDNSWNPGSWFNELVKGVYRFQAERFSIGLKALKNEVELLPDASNLPSVIANLLLEHGPIFKRYLADVRRILPQIHDIRAPTDGSGNVVLKVWKHDVALNRPELAFGLTESGTGVSQVLALVYVLTTSVDKPRTVLIDEPQAFLHPRALRALMELILDHPQHQYLIATHAPSVISLLRPERIVEVRQAAAHTESVCVSFGGDDIGALSGLVQNLDVRWSELFGWDMVLWVEGPREEACFKRILNHVVTEPRALRRLSHVGIKAVADTGGFEQRRASDIDRVFRVYEMASKPQLVLPARVAIVLDSENRNDATKQRLSERASAANVEMKWLGRAMYEDYLLDADAIAALLTHCTSSPFADEDVQHALAGARAKGLSAARMLAETVGLLTGHSHSYDKVRHGEWLTQWLLRHRPSALDDVKSLLLAILA